MNGDTTTQLQRQIERLQAGDLAQVDALIDRACERLRRLTRKILQDFPVVRQFDDSEDVLHDSVFRMMRRLKASPPASVQDFFQMAAREIRCELLDLVRKLKGREGRLRNETPLADNALEPADSSHGPDKLAAWTVFHEQIAALATDEQTVFDLMWYHGMTQEEAAQVLNCSLSTVKRRWLEARLKLQEHCPVAVA